ncbi:MAG: pbpC [Fibrobacteres bacterium]|nr:pbpC [Fibrobacterota bacterium]
MNRFLRPAWLRARARPVRAGLAVIAAGIALWLAVPPAQLFPDDYSLVIQDRNDRILRVFLAKDQQWRFPTGRDSIPDKYRQALFAYEDKRFPGHPGIDPLALLRAASGRLSRGRKAGGASTLTMQLVRLAHPKERSYFNKALEMAQALRLELHLSKDEILRTYLAHAPMGGNVVGVETACYRYGGKPLSEITWAEAALFAVLPNSPSWIHLGRERPRLRAKRDALLRKLNHEGRLDSLDLALATEEPLPDSADLPIHAPHFTESLRRSGAVGRVRASLDLEVQGKVEAQAAYRVRLLREQGIHNLAILVVETGTGKVRAYLGSPDAGDREHQGQVDGVRARRSTGSLLKPFLYARLMDRGPYLAGTKIADIPTYYGSFAPQNASREFSGLVGLDEALIRSLNVPAVRALYEYGLEDFYAFLKQAGLRGLFRPPEGYGLPLILGGAEASLWELTGMYLALGNDGVRRPFSVMEPAGPPVAGSPKHEAMAGVLEGRPAHEDSLFSAGAAGEIRSILGRLKRPESELYWQYFNNQVPVSWKTGTSYGQKDGWAIGTNAQWTIGVWVGNFSGQGNGALGGGASAAPILFLLFNDLTDRNRPMDIPRPNWDLAAESTCVASGYPAGPACPLKAASLRPASAYVTRLCPYHKRFLVDRRTGLETCSRCWSGKDTAWVVREIHPPSLRSWEAQSGRNPDNAPAHDPKCPAYHGGDGLELVYPTSGTRLFVPRDLDGRYQQVVLEAAHARQDALIFWYLDGRFLTTTKGTHKVPVDLPAGPHRLSVEDDEGRTADLGFEAFRREEPTP